MIKKAPLAEVGWGTSITEDFELTLRLYEKGYKVLYTPYIQAPSECVSTLKRLVKQRMRWAEGHSFNVKKMFRRLMTSPNLTIQEKLEFLYLSPYYLQALFFIIGTMAWLVSETIFKVRIPFWTAVWGWSLVITNIVALPLLNAVGLFVEESERRDYSGLGSFIALSYLLVPFQAYAAVKGFMEKEEGPWFRTPKTGRITDVFARSGLIRFIQDFIPSRQESVDSKYLALSSANSTFDSFKITKKKAKWVGKAFLATLLIISNLVLTLAPSVPYFIRPNNVQAKSFDVIGDKTNNQVPEKGAPVVDSYPNGVLALNTDKNYYEQGETIKIMMGVLDKNGDTLCNADLTLIVYSPDDTIKTFATENNKIHKSTSCKEDNNVTDKPDYFVNFKANQKGVYRYDLINNKNQLQINGIFEVKTGVLLKVERSSATRINPFKSAYKMQIKVLAKENVKGVLKDAVPSNFQIVNGDTSWNINLKKGQSEIFEYTYQSPKVSPEIFNIGPMVLEQGKSVTPLESHSWQIASDVTCTAAASANWSLPTTWAAGCGGNGPIAGDTVNIGAFNVTVNTATPAAAILNFTSTGGTLTITSPGVLTLSGALTENNSATTTWTNTITGTGSLSAASITVGSNTTPTTVATRTTTLTMSLTSTTLTGNLTVRSLTGSTTTRVNNGVLTVTSGTINVGGSVATVNGNAVNNSTITLGNSSPTLNLSSATPWSITATGTSTTTLNGTGATVNYSGSAPTGRVTTYTNLTLSGSGATTFATTPTVNGVLSMEGTASVTVTTGVVTYGSAATLQYNKTGSYTATTEEWISPFVATGGIIIKNTGAITTPGVVQIGNNTSVPLNINGGTLTPGSNLITLHGDFINTGTLTSGSGGVTIAGTTATQSIGGFTTTGTVSMTKTSGTATFTGNVNGGAFTMNGSGGTLNLGAGFTHAFTGTWTNTAGTLSCSSSTIQFAGSTSGTAITFNANTGTVEYNGSGAQTVLAFTYNNLILSNAGAKTMTSVVSIGGGLTISGSATMTGNAAFTVTGTFTYSSSGSTTLASATAISIGKFSQSGGTLNDNGNTITVTGTGATTWTTSSGTFTTSGTASFTGAAPQIGLSNFNNLTLNPGASNTVTATGTITVAAALTISSGIFSPGSNTINVAGNFANSGTFTAGASTINLNGAGGSTQTISGTNTFYTLTATGSSARTIKFPSGVTTTITNSLTLTGAASQLLSLSPSTASTTWYIMPPATQSVSYVNATYSTSTTCISAANSSGSNDVFWSLTGGSCFSPTSFSFQRKTWYDGTRFWRAYQDTTNSRIRFDYSINSGGSWTENTSAQISVNTYDFSIEANSTNLFIVYTTSNDIRGRIASSYPGTGFTWGSESTILNGTGNTDDYSYPVITRDSSNIVWAGAKYTAATTFTFKTIHHPGAANTMPTDASDTIYSLSASVTDSNVYGTIVSIGSQNMYSTFVSNTALEGCKWVNASTAWQNSTGGACGGSGGSLGGNKIDDASNFGTMGESNRQVVRSSGGNLYAAVRNSTSCEIWKSSNGSSWTQMDSSNNPSCLGTSMLSIAIDTSGIIHMIYTPDGAIIKYLTFDTSTDTFVSPGSPETAYTTTDQLYEYNLSIDSNNKPHIDVFTDTFNGLDFDCKIEYTNRVSSWKSPVNIVTTGAADCVGVFLGISIAIDEDNLPLVSTENFSSLIAYVGDTNDATTFTGYTVDSSISFYGYTSIAVDSSGNTWIGFVDENGATDYASLYKRTDGSETSSWSTGWSSVLTNSNGASKVGIAANGTNIYVLYINSASDIVYDKYNGSTWSGETTLQTGTFVDLGAKWAYNADNQYSQQIDFLYSDSLDIYWGAIGLGARDSIATITNGVITTISATSDGSNVHLVYIDSSGHAVYQEFTSSWQTAVTLDSNSGNMYPTISIDTSTNNVYAFWVRTVTGTDHVYYKSSSSPYTSWSSATDWHTGTNITYLTSNASTSGYVFAEWSSGASQPYSINWDVIAVPENLRLLLYLGFVIPFYLRRKKSNKKAANLIT